MRNNVPAIKKTDFSTLSSEPGAGDRIKMIDQNDWQQHFKANSNEVRHRKLNNLNIFVLNNKPQGQQLPPANPIN